MKHYNIAAQIILIIVSALLLFNRNLFSLQHDAAITTKESEEHVEELANISKNLSQINQQFVSLSDRVANLERKQINNQQPQANNSSVKPLVTSIVDRTPQEGVADSDMMLLAQATGVTTTQLATMNASEIEALNEHRALERDKQYFKQLEQHFYAGKSATFDRVYEQSITDSVNLDELSNSKISNISCDNAMCRVEVKHNDAAAMNKFLDKVPGLSLWNTEAVVDFPENGDKPTSIIYLARKDHSLPTRSVESR